MISSTSGATSAAFTQLQRQQAERNVEQAEQRARSLRAEARQANAEANRAQERARSLEVETDQASQEAGRARSGLIASNALQQVGVQVRELRERIVPATPDEAPASTTPAPRPVVNAQGEVTGTVINISV